MSKAKEKRAARKAYEKKLAGQIPSHPAKTMKRAMAELGYHNIRREYQIHMNAGNGEIWHNGIWRYLWNEFVPDIAGEASYEDSKEIMTAFDAMLAKDAPNRKGLVERILSLGRLSPRPATGKEGK